MNLSCLFTIILEFKDYFEGKWNDGIKLFKTQPNMTYEGLLNYKYARCDILVFAAAFSAIR